ncbi:MAG: helix-turn-helix domain-containing protein [Anaerolineae bacterium]|jgi:AraC-like DNA-binding protein
MTVQAPREQTKLWRLSTSYGDVELMRATYVTQTFARHSHERFAIGVIENGALGFYYRGENVVAPTGSVNLANSGEPHDGHAATEAGWIYRMCYLDLSLLQQAASEVVGHPRGIPFFQTGVIHDDYLAGTIRRLHIAFEAEPNTSALEQESRMLEMLSQLIVRHADDRPAPRAMPREDRAVTRAREYLEAHYAENISLDQLAHVANLSPFHLAHVFRDQMGLSPHAYLTQVRVKQAKTLLGQGWSIAQTACEVGFADQSHLTRRFKRVVGMTPGQYRKIVQDGRTSCS